MMLQLRDYQQSAIDALFEYWNEKPGSPLIVVPTAGGKSAIMATICETLLRNWPDMRILICTHVRELILSNYRELVTLWPFAPAGIYSAGVGRRDAHAQIVFGGVQTIANKAREIGHIDLVMVDEAHLIPRNSETQYGKLLDGLKAINPDLKLIGLTATPYRLGEGMLHEGDGAIFDDICYEKPIGELIAEGYLAKPISKGTATSFDLSGVGKLGGDYKQNALQAAVDQIDINRAVVDEIMSYGDNRRAWLLFCSGVEHAMHMRDEIRSRGISCETITGETPTGERDRIIEEYRAGRIRAVTNNSVMTTGTNVPIIDLVAFCRPTLSPGLYIQMAGRGLRLYPGKQNCLFLDFAGVVRKHGPIDMVTPPKERRGNGDAPVKDCPTEADIHGKVGCGSIVHASCRTCPDCGYEFIIEETPKIAPKAEDVPIISTEAASSRIVDKRQFSYNEGKGGKPPTVKVGYRVGYQWINEWICPEEKSHPYARSNAQRYWKDHGGQRPFPNSVLQWLERQNELKQTAEISVTPGQKGYWTVVGRTVGDYAADNDNSPQGDNDNHNVGDKISAGMRDVWDDDSEIPF